MNKSFWIGFSSCLFVVSVGVVEYYPQIADALYSIPPTNAFSSIKIGDTWYNATSYADSIEIPSNLTGSINITSIELLGSLNATWDDQTGELSLKLKPITCGLLQGLKGIDADGNLFCAVI